MLEHGNDQRGRASFPTCTKDLVLFDNMDVRMAIVGKNVIPMARGAGWLWSVDMAIGLRA
jgi:hypothetical protein